LEGDWKDRGRGMSIVYLSDLWFEINQKFLIEEVSFENDVPCYLVCVFICDD